MSDANIFKHKLLVAGYFPHDNDIVIGASSF